MPYDSSVNSILLLDYIELGLNEDHRIVSISGLSGKAGWIERDISFVSNYESGGFILDYKLGSGKIIKIAENVPIYFNKNTNWVCIGSDKIHEDSTIIRIFENTYAVLNNTKSGEFSFWAKIRTISND